MRTVEVDWRKAEVWRREASVFFHHISPSLRLTEGKVFGSVVCIEPQEFIMVRGEEINDQKGTKMEEGDLDGGHCIPKL